MKDMQTKKKRKKRER